MTNRYRSYLIWGTHFLKASSCVALILTFSISHLVSVAHAQKPPQSLAPVNATIVRSQVITSQQAFIGTVTPIRQSIIGSAVAGRVVDVMVEEGDEVIPSAITAAVESSEIPSDGVAVTEEEIESIGFPIVQLRTGTMQIQIEAAEVELANRAAALEELQNSIPADIEQAQANVAVAQAKADYSKDEWERNQRISGEGAGVSRSELGQSNSTFVADAQSLLAAKALLKKLTLTKQSRLAQAQTLMQSQVEAIRLLEDLKKKYTIRAPFRGYVSKKFSEVGQWVSAGDQIAEIVQLDPIEIVISVPQAVISDFQLSLDQSIADQQAMPATLSLRSGGPTLQGRVTKIVPQADLRSRAFPVKIRVDNPRTASGHWLNPGMLAQVHVSIGSESKKVLVDKDALVLNNDSSTLILIDRNVQPQTVRVVPVKTGQAVGQMIEVIGEIKPNDWVVVEGNERLRPGQQVNVLNAAELQSEIDTATASLPSQPHPTK